jgi:eukaryotic-like serine/threonine-protein kinase
MNSCGRCGATLSETVLGGLCPRCVARAAFRGGSSGSATTVGDYEILSEIGRGGMGIVYLARQRSLDRLVAVKMLVSGARAGADAEERFAREACEAAQLHHPHIVAIHEVGRHDGLPFYSMDFIEGEDVETYVGRRRPSPRIAATLTARAARAVQHAHDAGVLHRDVKPANVLIDADGQPHLTDFGLAVSVNGGAGLTQTGTFLGSPGYMAPEQMHGVFSVASDVYGLGAVFYFMLTGRAPFVAARLTELLAALERGDPLPPRRLDPSIPRDLETIALRALAREPNQRYAAAAALADDLERWLGGRPIHARPVSVFGRAWRWARRNRSLAVVVVLLAASLFAGVAGIAWQWRRAKQAAERTALHLYAADLKVASDALHAGDLGLARRALHECPVELRDAAWGVLWPRTRGDVEAELGSAGWTVTDLAVSRDARLAASTAQSDNVRLWDLVTGKSIDELPDTASSWWAAFSPDGRTLFTSDRVTKQWDLERRVVVREFPGQSGALAPDGRVLYTCLGHRFVFEGAPGAVAAWALDDGQQMFELPIDARVIALSPDGAQLAISDAETYIALHDARSGGMLSERWQSRGRLWHLAFSPEGQRLVASGWSTAVRVWDLADPMIAPQVLEHPLNSWEAAFSPDGRTLAVGCSDRQVHLWDASTWKLIRTLRGHYNEVWSVAWQSAGHLLSSGRDARVLRLRNEEHATRSWLRHEANAPGFVWLPGGALATVQRGDEARPIAVIGSARHAGGEARFPDEIPIAFDAQTGRLWLWANDHELRGRLVSQPNNVVRVPWTISAGESFADTPKLCMTARCAWVPLNDGALVIHDLDDGRRTARHESVFARSPPRAAALSPDGRRFVWGGVSGELFHLDLETGQRRSLSGHRYDVASVAFAPDGRSFVTGGVDGFLFIWDTMTGQRLHDLGQHATSADQLTFTPDGRLLFASEVGVGIHLWHLATLREVGFIEAKDPGVDQWVEASPDGRWLGLRMSDGDVRTFPIASPQGELP